MNWPPSPIGGNLVTHLIEVEGQIASLHMLMKTKVSPSAYDANTPYSFYEEDTSLFIAH
jgi:hypothetical protein